MASSVQRTGGEEQGEEIAREETQGGQGEDTPWPQEPFAAMHAFALISAARAGKGPGMLRNWFRAIRMSVRDHWSQAAALDSQHGNRLQAWYNALVEVDPETDWLQGSEPVPEAAIQRIWGAIIQLIVGVYSYYSGPG
eukprot:GHVU01188769.1.p1 GENE.GHVU01188769.1~~GHVU01188769.1.p1  ORF type:complete len:138 (+),score=18.08 GHVU01188769.1:1-414(+)